MTVAQNATLQSFLRFVNDLSWFQNGIENDLKISLETPTNSNFWEDFAWKRSKLERVFLEEKLKENKRTI